MEQFGEAALPLLNKIIDKFSALTEWFSKLSPATKEMLVNVGAFVAMGGPILLIAGNIIKTTQAVIGLGTALKALAGSMGPILALVAASTAIVTTYKDMTGLNFNPFTLGLEGLLFGKGEKDSPKLGTTNRGGAFSGYTFKPQKYSGGGMPTLPTAPKSQGQTLVSSGSWIQGGIPGGGSSSPREQYANEPLPMRPFNLDLTMIERAIPKLDDLKSGFSGVTESLITTESAYKALGDGIAGVVTDMATAFSEGANGFAAFGKAALSMAAQVVKAMLAVILAKATAAAATEGGPIGAVIGLGIAIGVVESLQSMIGKIKVPKLAQGGASAGPMMAILGDNPSGKEMALPWEKTGDFARKIGREMGGGGGNLSVTVRGDDLLVMLSRSQARAARRGSANTIKF